MWPDRLTYSSVGKKINYKKNHLAGWTVESLAWRKQHSLSSKHPGHSSHAPGQLPLELQSLHWCALDQEAGSQLASTAPVSPVNTNKNIRSGFPKDSNSFNFITFCQITTPNIIKILKLFKIISYPSPLLVPFVSDVFEGMRYRFKGNITQSAGVKCTRIAMGILKTKTKVTSTIFLKWTDK